MKSPGTINFEKEQTITTKELTENLRKEVLRRDPELFKRLYQELITSEPSAS